jgi:hypothetical protein
MNYAGITIRVMPVNVQCTTLAGVFLTSYAGNAKHDKLQLDVVSSTSWSLNGRCGTKLELGNENGMVFPIYVPPTDI